MPIRNAIFSLSLGKTDYIITPNNKHVKLFLLIMLNRVIVSYVKKHLISSCAELCCKEISNITYLALLSSAADKSIRCIVAEAGRGLGSAWRLGTSPGMPWRARLYLPRSTKFIF